MRRFIAALLLTAMIFSAAGAPAEDLPDVEFVEEELPDEDNPEEPELNEDAPAEREREQDGPAEDFRLGVEPEPSAITPAYRSEEHADHGEGCYWCTPMDLTDEHAIWAMLTSPMTVADINMNKQTVVYAEPDENSEGIGMLTGQSQGVHVLETLDNGWTKVETYSTSFHDSKVKNFNAFVTGYVPTKKLKTIQVNQKYGIIIDKLTQRLYLFKDGHLETSMPVSTGKYNPKAKKQQPYNETRSGEYIIVYTKTGSLNDEDSGMVCSYALKFNAADYIHEVPHRKNADGTKNFRGFEEVLGTRASHGCIRVQAKKNQDGYSMAILAGLIKKEKTPVKLVVWEDYQGRQVTIPRDDTPLYYNPNKGTMYHAVADCASVNKKFLPLMSFTFAELDDAPYSKLKACPFCVPTPRRAALEEINAEHLETSPGDVMSVYGKK